MPNSTQQNINDLYFSPARGAKVRDQDGNAVNAVFGTFAVHTDKRNVSDALIARWPEIAQAAEIVAAAIVAEAESG